ncbi:MAG: triacylglycerol lipase [Chthoniobacteraceae bacterium]
MKGRHLLIPVALMMMISAIPGLASNESTSPEAVALSPQKCPVVLVHGFKDTSRKMQQMAASLRREGRTVYTPTLAPSFGEVGLDELAGQLSVFINATLKPGEKFDLVGFSMGGLVCRYYLQRMGGLSRVERFITLGAPHHGSLWACLIANSGCRQMRPGSEFLNDLNGDVATLGTIDFTSIWTPLDLMILPSNSSHTTVGREIKLWVPLHPLLVWSPLCIRNVVSLLR